MILSAEGRPRWRQSRMAVGHGLLRRRTRQDMASPTTAVAWTGVEIVGRGLLLEAAITHDDDTISKHPRRPGRR